MNRFREIWLPVLALLPSVYLVMIWRDLPKIVAIHFDLHGQANGWGDKTMLIIISSLAIFVYLLLLCVPLFDKKNRGNKYYSLRFSVGLLMSLISIYALHSCKAGSISGNFFIVILGGSMIWIGRYFPTISPNYFIGIRTPWTLRSNTVWNKTHHFSSMIWIVGGCSLILLSFVLAFSWLTIFTGIILIVASIIPVIYSYCRVKK